MGPRRLSIMISTARPRRIREKAVSIRTAEASCVVVEANALLGTGPWPC
eukprot:COSAG01_NODE_960_length_12416_cov_3.072501_5_plen_49_part_00